RRRGGRSRPPLLGDPGAPGGEGLVRAFPPVPLPRGASLRRGRSRLVDLTTHGGVVGLCVAAARGQPEGQGRSSGGDGERALADHRLLLRLGGRRGLSSRWLCTVGHRPTPRSRVCTRSPCVI